MFSVKADGKTLHIDPAYIKSRNKPPAELKEKADIVLFTHDHNDHCRKDTLPHICGEHTRMLAPAACARKIGGHFGTMKAGMATAIGGFSVRAVEAYNLPENHPDRVWHPKGKGIGYLVTIGGKAIYHAGDTDFIPEMKAIGPVDVALLLFYI